MSLERIVAQLVQRVDQRFYGKYRGLVVENDDPEQLGRLKVRVPSLLGETVTGWAMPCVPYGGAADQGCLWIPEVDSGVWIEFEEGDWEFPIWVGTFWSKPSGTPETPTLNDQDGTAQSAPQSPPTRKIFKTAKGHTIQFEDKTGDELVLIYEATNHHRISMSKAGIVVEDGTGNRIALGPDALTITAKVPFTLDAAGQPIVLIGDTIDLKKG